jgi:hypothetical protein
MEEEKEMKYPYYEMTYLDDNNNMHLAKVQNIKEVTFLQNRFEVLDYHLIQTV